GFRHRETRAHPSGDLVVVVDMAQRYGIFARQLVQSLGSVFGGDVLRAMGSAVRGTDRTEQEDGHADRCIAEPVLIPSILADFDKRGRLRKRPSFCHIIYIM